MRSGAKSALAALAAAALCGGCVPVPGEIVQAPYTTTTIVGGVFPGLDPGAKDVSSLHFHVWAYGIDGSQQAADAAETQYQRIMTDTGLYSFKPLGLYSLVVYGTKDEYQKKTRQPDWSAGVSVANAIYAYEGPYLKTVIAHEMTHLIFHEYMGEPRLELRWLNEGLAVHEERRAAGAPAGPSAGTLEATIPFDQMVALVPATERERGVSLWYRQVASVVGFLIERGGRIGFSQLLGALRDGRSFEEGLRTSFPGVWTSAADLEAAWRRSF